MASFRSLLHRTESDLGASSPRSIGSSSQEIVAVAERPTDRSSFAEVEREGQAIHPLELSLAAPGSNGAGSVDALREASGRATERGLFVETALVEAVVRRVSWGGDRRRGVARIELDGVFSGTTLWIRGEGRVVELEVALGPGLEAIGLPERLLGRLRARGLQVLGLEVR